MTEIPVYAETPSALADPCIVEDTSTTVPVLVAWHPERGWLCSATGHQVQPCEHTASLVPSKSPLWRQ